MTEAEFIEHWNSLTIRENHIFSKTMELKPELILCVKIRSINYLEREKVIDERTDCRGIRLDVYVEDKDNNRSFDVEMQISDSDNLGRRMRYYQGMIDADKLKHGQKYRELGESYIVFICTFDKFLAGRHIYTFKNFCAEDKSIALDDGAAKIFLNTKSTADDVNEDVHNFLMYVERANLSRRLTMLCRRSNLTGR